MKEKEQWYKKGYAIGSIILFIGLIFVVGMHGELAEALLKFRCRHLTENERIWLGDISRAREQFYNMDAYVLKCTYENSGVEKTEVYEDGNIGSCLYLENKPERFTLVLSEQDQAIFAASYGSEEELPEYEPMIGILDITPSWVNEVTVEKDGNIKRYEVNYNKKYRTVANALSNDKSEGEVASAKECYTVNEYGALVGYERMESFRIPNGIEYDRRLAFTMLSADRLQIVEDIKELRQGKYDAANKYEAALGVSQEGAQENHPATPDELGKLWSQGFMMRDGELLYSLLADKDMFEELAGDAEITEDGRHMLIGWSSPWPFAGGENFTVDEANKEIKITYPAFVSDPHITYWIETLRYEEKEGRLSVIGEEMLFGDAVESIELFEEVYRDGVIDYEDTKYQLEEDGRTLADILYENSKTVNESYDMLHSPGQAAAFLWNLSGGSAEIADEDNKEAKVKYTWDKDGESILIQMKKIGQEDGIWIPKTILQ